MTRLDKLMRATGLEDRDDGRPTRGGVQALTMLAVVAVAMIALASGCASSDKPSVPAGYDADLTPTHNGETWIGGR